MHIKIIHSEEEWEEERKKQGSWGNTQLFDGWKPTANLMLLSWLIGAVMSFLVDGGLLWGIIPLIITVLVIYLEEKAPKCY